MLIDVLSINFLRNNWPSQSLGNLLAELQYGTSKRVDPPSDQTVPVLRIPNVTGGRVRLDDLGHVELSENDREKYRLHRNDVLIVRTNGNANYVGRTAVVSEVPPNTVYASYLIRLRCDEQKLLPTYLHTALASPRLRQSIRHEIRSSAGNYNLNTKGIKRQVLPVPPLEDQEQFVSEIQSRQESFDQMIQHIARVRQVRFDLINDAYDRLDCELNDV